MSQTQAPQHQDMTFFIGLFLGGLLGALIVVLLGTEKGRKLAHKLQKEGIDFLEDKEADLKDRFSDVTQKGEALIEKGKELMETGQELKQAVVEQAVETKDDFIVEAAAKADETLAHIERLQEQGREATAQMRRKLFKNIPKRV
jgi:gas vesicle protein